MDEYVIINIEENNGGSDGHIIIVKANPVREAKGFKHLLKMFGKTYYEYAMTECDDTKVFVFPFTEETMNHLLRMAKFAEEEKQFWHPNINEFYNSNIINSDGVISRIYKHNSFNSESVTSGIKEVVDLFKHRELFNSMFDDGKEKVTYVKKVHLGEGCTFTGNAILAGDICMPTGYGIKVYESLNNKTIASFFRVGSIGNVAFISYPKHHMYVGCVNGEKSNGWGFYLAKGCFTFGYYKEDKLYKDLTILIVDIYSNMRKQGLDIGHIDEGDGRIAFGLLPKENRPFTGFQFFNNGTVYIGYGTKYNEYELTGRFMRFDINGMFVCGDFVKGEIKKELSQEEFFSNNPLRERIANIDMKSDYLRYNDSGLYLIISLETVNDYEMGTILSIMAISKAYLVDTDTVNVNNIDKNLIDFFYLRSDNNINSIIYHNAQLRNLWKINLDDFHTLYHHAYLFNTGTLTTTKQNIHIHNALKGLEYKSVVDFVQK